MFLPRYVCEIVVRFIVLTGLPGAGKTDMLARLAAARFVACSESGAWLLARSADSVRLAEVVRLFGLALPPTIEDSSDEDGGEVHRCYRMLLAGLERTADLPLASLKRAGDQRG